MLQDKIISYFQRNPKLKVLFFFDPDGTSLSEVKELMLDEVWVKYFQQDWFNAKLERNALQDNEKVFKLKKYYIYPRILDNKYH